MYIYIYKCIYIFKCNHIFMQCTLGMYCVTLLHIMSYCMFSKESN